jgi:hypothetical protein
MAKSAEGFRGQGIAYQRAEKSAAQIASAQIVSEIANVDNPAGPARLNRKVESVAVNYFKTNSSKDLPVDRMKNETMPAEDERRELVPVIIAGIVAAIGLFCLWADLRDDSLGRGDGMITSAVVSRTGVIVTPSEPPGHLGVPQATPAFEPSTVGRVTR